MNNFIAMGAEEFVITKILGIACIIILPIYILICIKNFFYDMIKNNK